jgi:hypothetical protein
MAQTTGSGRIKGSLSVPCASCRGLTQSGRNEAWRCIVCIVISRASDDARRSFLLPALDPDVCLSAVASRGCVHPSETRRSRHRWPHCPDGAADSLIGQAEGEHLTWLTPKSGNMTRLLAT